MRFVRVKVEGVVMAVKPIETKDSVFYQVDLYQKGERELVRLTTPKEYSEGEVVSLEVRVFPKVWNGRVEVQFREVV